MRILTIALSLLLLLRSSEAALTNSNAARLAKLGVPPYGTGYDPSTPPWEVTGKPLTVRVTLVFRDILNVDELSCEATIMTQVNQYFVSVKHV